MTTTIKVPVELRDRLAERARREHTTLAGTIAHLLDTEETTAFWDDVRSTMTSPGAQQAISSDAGTMVGSLTDGLEPEDWSDVL